MEDVDFSDEFCRFVQTQLPSVDAAELLLALYRSPDASWQEVLTAVPGMDEPVAARQLEAFRGAGLLDPELRYRPASAELARHVATLAQAYERRPVTLVRLVYALRDRKIRSFADAFKLRKD